MMIQIIISVDHFSLNSKSYLHGLAILASLLELLVQLERDDSGLEHAQRLDGVDTSIVNADLDRRLGRLCHLTQHEANA